MTPTKTDTEPEGPRHGAVRDWHLRTESGAVVAMTDEDGRPLLQAPLHTATWSSAEQYCDTCQRWYLVEGVTGALRWIAEHDGPHDPLPLEVHPNGY